MKPLSSLLLALGAASIFASPSVAQTPTAVAYAPPSRSTPLASTFVAWGSLGFRATPVGLYCAVFDEPTPSLEKIEVHVTVLNPGMASHTPHQHPWEEMLLIKEGRLEVSINGRKVPAGPGSLVFVASRDAHNITNVGKTPATYYVINFVTAKVHSVPDKPAADWEPANLLSSRVVDCDSLTGGENPNGSHRTVFDSPTATFERLESHVTTLRVGASTKANNRDPGDELFILKSGRLEVTLNGISARLGAGSLYYVAPNDARTMRNIGTVPAVYQVIKVVSEKSPPQA